MLSCSLSYLWWYRKLYVVGACIKVEINDVKVDLDGLETCISGNPFDMVAKIQSSQGLGTIRMRAHLIIQVKQSDLHM